MNRIIVLMLAVALIAVGCGKESKEEGEADAKFRVPDSLLSPLDSYRLTKDEYHPVRGGVMANRELELQYPASSAARFVAMKVFGYALDAYRKVEESYGRPSEAPLYMVGAKDLDEYRFLTRKEWWYYGVVQGDTIYFEPLDIMLKRGILEMGVTQKICQVALDRRSGGRIPLWLKEGLASRLADEWTILEAQKVEFETGEYDLTPSPDEIEKALADATSRPLTRIAFYGAYIMVDRLISISDWESIGEFIDLIGEGRSYDEASREAFGTDYGSLLGKIELDRSFPDGM
jgi:hypothetical protein